MVVAATLDDADRGTFLEQSWRERVTGDIAVHAVACGHHEMLTVEALAEYGKHLGGEAT